MIATRRILVALGVSAFAAVAMLSSAGATTRVAYKPVIGKPVSTPAQAVAGKRFVVLFKVTRSDTQKPLVAGTMTCDPSVAGKVIRHTESFRAGTARLAFVVPATAQGKMLKVKVGIKAPGGGAATKVSLFRVAAAVKPTLSIADASVTEGNAGTVALSFPVTLSTATTQVVSVGYATSDVSATAPADYAAATGKLVFKPGTTTQTITVSVVGDTTVEQDETVGVTLSSPVNATIVDGSATGTIKNDDVAPRSGHYAGTTSQGRSIAFDVSSDLTAVTNLVVHVDLKAVEVPVVFADQTVNFSAVAIPMAADGSFAFNGTQSDSDLTLTVALNGKLVAPGTASGTLRIDMILNTDGGPVHLSTGDVTWTAS